MRTLREDIDKKLNPDKAKVGEIASKLLSKIQSKVKVDSSKVKELMASVKPEMTDSEVRSLFENFFGKVSTIDTKEVVDVVMKIYLLNMKSGKKTTESIITALGIGIKFISDKNDVIPKDKTSLNEIVSRSIKMDFWKFMKWLLIAVLVGIALALLIRIEQGINVMVSFQRTRFIAKCIGMVCLALSMWTGGISSIIGSAFLGAGAGSLSGAWLLN